MTAFVSNPVKSGFLVRFDNDGAMLKDKPVTAVVEGDTLLVTIVKPSTVKASRGNATHVAVGVLDYKCNFGNTEFETEIKGDCLLIHLNKPVGKLKAPIARSTISNDDRVRAAIKVINSLNRDIWRVYLNTTNNHISLKKLEDFV